MIKRIVTLLLAVSMLGIFPLTVGAVEEKRDYAVGGTYTLDLSKAVETVNASASASLSVTNGSAKYEFLLPFYADKMKIKSSSAGSIDLKINDETYTITLTGEPLTYTFPTAIRMGEKDLTISAGATVNISEIVFDEITEEEAVSDVLLDISEYENALSHSFIIREGSPVIKANSAVRYLDYNNLNILPTYIGGNLYLPAKAMAEAMSCYFEEDKAKDFMVVRKSTTELVYLNGNFKVIKNGVEEAVNIQKHEIAGVTFLPLRFVAELFDRYVLYKDGFVIVDYRSSAKAIATSYYNELKKEFDKYMPTGIVGKTYYVSKEAHASDLNDGSKERPFATVTKACAVAVAGDTVIIGGGEYNELFKPLNDGTATAPITFKAAEGEDVLFTACDEITGFADYINGMVVAPIPWDLGIGRNQVFYNGKHLIEGRYPNPVIKDNGLVTFSDGIDLDPVWITVGDLKVSKKPQTYIYSDTLLQEEEKDYWKDAVFVSQHGSAWTLSSAIVKSSEKGKAELRNTSEKWWWGNNYENHPNYGYLTGHIHTLDMPGEWTIKNGLIYIIPPEGETADTLKLLVKRRQLLFDLNDRKYIHVEGIRGFGGGARMNNAEMCVLNGVDMSYYSHYLYFNDNRNLYIDDNNPMDPNGAPQRGEVGIFIGGNNNAVINSKLSYSAGTGVFFAGSYGYVSNNVIHDIGYGGTSCGAIHFDTEMFMPMETKRGGHTVLNNTVYNVARNAVSVSRSEGEGWSKASFLPCEIAYNDIYNSSICTLDTGMIYMWGSDMANGMNRSSVHNNYVYGISRENEQILGAIYFDNWMAGVDTYDNVIFANRERQFNNDIYEQRKKQFATSYATVDSWNNINLGFRSEGKAQLEVNDFPSAKPFKAGSSLADFDYNLTYESYTNGNKGIYKDENIVASEGVAKTENGYKFTAEKQIITFKNIDFTDVNMLNLVYTADYYKENDKYMVVIGDLTSPVGYENVTLYPESKNLNDLNTVHIDLRNYDVENGMEIHLVPVKFGGATIVSANTNKRYRQTDGYQQDYKKVMVGVFDRYYWDQINAEGPPVAISRPVDPVFPILQAAWGGNWVAFDQINVSADATKFKVSLGTGGQWANGTVSLRIGSPNAEPIATIQMEDTDWEYKEYSCDLKETLKAGVYNLYLTFEGNGSCSDVHWFGIE